MSRFDCHHLQLVHPTLDRGPAGNPQHGTAQTASDTPRQSGHSLHALLTSFLFPVSVAVLPFLKQQSIIHRKCSVFSSIVNIKMAAQILTNFANFFLNAH